MYLPTHFKSREKLFDFLDDYAAQRKPEIDQKEITAKRGLIKSYVLETSAHPRNGNTIASLGNLGWQLTPFTGEQGLYGVRVGGTDFGYLEAISPRYYLVHSFQETSEADKVVRRVEAVSEFDLLWLAGDYFNALWHNLILNQMPDRIVSFRFEHDSRFESPDLLFDEDAEDQSENEDTRKLDAEEITERPALTSTITEQARRIGKFLPALQEVHSPFKAVKMLRVPSAATRGGYDFWSWGKVTYRATSFREGREQTLNITNIYDLATRVIERMLWLHVETISTKGENGGVLHGAPVVMEFAHELAPATFQSLINVTFEKGEGPLRLWGNPIWLGEDKVHIYGIDMHLWQRIYLELTTQRVVALLPLGTCGNTIHRLLTNIQRFVDPGVKMWIGGLAYSDLIRDVLLGKIKE
jgi:hypothetical protein